MQNALKITKICYDVSTAPVTVIHQQNLFHGPIMLD